MLINLKKDTYDTFITSKADKSLYKISKNDKKAVKILLTAIKEISKDPYNSKLLKGKLKGNRRIRKDPYRIIFAINNEKKIIKILNIDKRDKIYKKYSK